MSEMEVSLYTLAENLGKMRHELDAMPSSEYFGWIKFYQEKSRKQEADNGNLLAMSDEDLIKGLTGG